MAVLPAAPASASSLRSWVARIEDRTARIGIIGLGYVGLPIALEFSAEHFPIVGFDIDETKVSALNEGRSYIQHITPEEIHGARQGGFRATADFAELSSLDVLLICVPTPLNDDHTPDMSFVAATVETVAPYLRAEQLLVLESTTYPGATEEIVVATIDRVNASRGLRVLRDTDEAEGDPLLDGVMVAFSPEREDPGNTTTARRDIPKVIGGFDRRATGAAAAVYGSIFRHVVPMSSPAAAEMTKLLENIYRCVNIALVNELKQLCLAMGIDIWEVIGAAATKPFGFEAFYPGPGVGGHCIPVDPFYLSWKAQQFGLPTRFIQLAGEVNEAMPQYVVEATVRALERADVAIGGARILVLGVAYKRDVDDLRESPSLRIIEILQQLGAEVAYNDPFFPTVGSGRKYHLQLESQPLSTIPEFDCVLLVTDHSAYNYRDIVDAARLLIDSRNATRAIRSDKIVRC